uniref:Uncharacterized protein n=1 Tax=Enterobacter sp. HP19 TaxID=1811975 RepID=A0A2H4UED3_9ENTR|nr:hypothetical protein [Enterobacter sp. HP19]
MGYTKKQYFSIGIAFILVAFFGFIIEVTSDGSNVIGIQELSNILWKIFAVVGVVMFMVGAFKKSNKLRGE